MASIEELKTAIRQGRRDLAELVVITNRAAGAFLAEGSPELAAWLVKGA